MPLSLPRPVFDARIGSNSFGDLPEWDLTDLYTSPEAPEVDTDLAYVETTVIAFEADYKGKLADQTAAQLLACVQTYEAIETVAARSAVKKWKQANR